MLPADDSKPILFSFSHSFTFKNFLFCFVLFPKHPVSFRKRIGGESNHIFEPFVRCLLASVLLDTWAVGTSPQALVGGGSRIGDLDSPHLPNSCTASPGLRHIALTHPQAQSFLESLVETPAKTRHIRIECLLPTCRQAPQLWSQQALASLLYRVGVPETLFFLLKLLEWYWFT